MRTFEFRDGKSSKFWSIELQGKSFTVTFGRIGSKGQTQTKTFADEDKARKEHDKLVREKLAKGYAEKTAAPAPAAPSGTQKALEEALIENPEDLAAHSAYADYLSEQGDPRGEFIQVQLALEDPARPPKERKKLQQREKELLDQHGRQWLGGLAPYLLDQHGVPKNYLKYGGKTYEFRFARGWVEYLRLYELSGTTARAFRDNPLLRVVRHLVIPEMEYDDPGFDELVEAPHFANVRSFQLGPDDDSCRMDGEAAVQLVEKMPRLEELRLFAHNVDVKKLFALPLSHLRVLYVYHLTEYPLEVLAKNRTLGNLTELACWPHALEPGDESAYITPEGVKALVRSPHLKGLAHLQLRLTDLGDAGCEEIVSSGILKRIKTLDLTGGRVTDAGARTLAACPDVRNLEKLTLTNNFLTRAGVRALKAAGIAVEAKQQFDPAEIDSEDTEYLSYGDWE